MQVSSLVAFYNAIQHSVVSAEGQMMHPLLVSSYIAIEKRIAFISPILQMGGGKKNMHGSWLIIEHMWNPLCTNILFPQAVGEDMVNICWRDSDLCSSCHS